MISLSPAGRLDALAARGVMLYLAPNDELRAKCEPCFAHVLDAALPALRQHKAAIVAHLLERLTFPRSSVPVAVVASVAAGRPGDSPPCRPPTALEHDRT